MIQACSIIRRTDGSKAFFSFDQRWLVKSLIAVCLLFSVSRTFSQGTRLLRQPSVNSGRITYAYAGDIWITDLGNNETARITSTPAVESNPCFSPDGNWIAFSSNRSGNTEVYIVPAIGGIPKRLTWHPSSCIVRGWSPDGKSVLYATSRDNAPEGFNRLWIVSLEGGPSSPLSKQWANDGSFSADGRKIAIDRVSRWDVEWRHYRGGQNTPLEILNLDDQSEIRIPSESSYDIKPVWLGDKVYFLSDRDQTTNIWSFTPGSGELKQVTTFTGPDIKWLSGWQNTLAYERDGYLSLFDIRSNESKQLEITINGDFPWAETRWEDVTSNAGSVSLSPTGKRAIMEARGEIFTVPVENGDTRNITQSSGAADRSPVWSPKGNDIAWFSDSEGGGYKLYIASQDGLSKPKSISIGESKMAWEPAWSPDGKYIAFTDDKVRIRIVDVAGGTVKTAETGRTISERGDMGLCWSPDSKWLMYARTGSNNFRQIRIWSAVSDSIFTVTNPFADSFSPAWDRDSHHIYFLASTDLALNSVWANTSAMTSSPAYSIYIVNLRKDDPSPFKPKSDEESVEEQKKPSTDVKTDKAKSPEKKAVADSSKTKSKEPEAVKIDFLNIERRTTALPMPKRNYNGILSGPAGTLFIGERKKDSPGVTIHKFTLDKREAKEFVSGVNQISVSSDGNKMLAKIGNEWKLISTSSPTGSEGTTVKVSLKVLLNRSEEWKQIFEEAWRYERDYFYDPGLHGRDWNEVYRKYAPLVPFIRHRCDLTYILDQLGGELSVGHSFVFGGDYPQVDRSSTGLLGADLIRENHHWKINRIYTTESWNPDLTSPLDRPGIKVQEGYYLTGINGRELTDNDDPYQLLDGTNDIQTTVHINKLPEFAGSWQEVVKPIGSEYSLRQRAWVEDNRRLVDKLSDGKLAYVWVPNTSNAGLISFNRYFFAQQDKKGAVIDERFNGGGLLDDYMVDLMSRKLRAAITNEAPDGEPLRLPAGILGPKVLLINELSGSGGDFFPWIFRHQGIGPLIGTRTWGGLVASSVHYAFVDGGAMTAPNNAVFDPVNNKWVAENQGVPPDIEVFQDALALSKGKDPQLERAVQELVKLLEQQGDIKVAAPPFSTPAKMKN